MDLDISLLLTLGGMLVSVVSAAAIAKHQIKQIIDHLADLENRLRKLDSRLDRNDTTTETLGHRINILTGMMDPPTLERRHREIERLKAEVEFIQKALAK